MNPKNPQAAGEYVLVPREATNKMQVMGLSALDESDATSPGIGHQIGFKAIRELWAAMLAAAPAIAPGGDGMSAWIGKLGALVSAAKDRDLSAKDHAEAIDKAHSELFDTLQRLPADANAVTVDDAMVERAMRAYSDEAHKEGFSRPNGDGMDWHKRWMRAALTAAIAPAAASGGKCSNYPNCPKEFCSACIPPAAPPASGAWTADADKYGNALNEAAWTFVDVCPEKSALLFNNTKQALRAAILKYAEVVAAQEAARG